MSNICKTVKIVSSDEKSQGSYIEINECDFDAEKGHVLFESVAEETTASTEENSTSVVDIAVDPSITKEESLDQTEIVSGEVQEIIAGN